LRAYVILKVCSVHGRTTCDVVAGGLCRRWSEGGINATIRWIRHRRWH